MSAVPHPQEPVLLREDGKGVATLTLNRPAQMNLLTLEMLGALQSAFDAIAARRASRALAGSSARDG